MRFARRLRTVALVLCLWGLRLFAFAAPAGTECQMPVDLAQILDQQYPGTRVLRLVDLDPDSRSTFAREHGRACPGLVRLNFYGDGESTFALLLVPENWNPPHESKLVIDRRLTESWQVKVLESFETSKPAIWSMGPGVYRDVDGKRTISTKNSVIVVCEYESWAIVYAWNETQISKVWIGD